MKLKYAYGIVPGASGSEQKAECQDKIKVIKENGVSVISLAAKAAASVIAERFEEFCSSEEDVVKKAVLESIAETSGSVNSPLFVAVKGNRYLAGSMGGGLIAIWNDGCSVLSRPETENGEQAGLGVYRGELQEPFGFMLITGGACLSLYEYGTGNLSPACGTFFEWLKEYDEETVSDALADNINKYFLKEAKDDIGVALMMTDEDEAPLEEDGHNATPPEEDELDGEAAVDDELDTEEPAEPVEAVEPVEAGESFRETAKNRNYVRYLIAAALIVILAAVAVLTINPPGSARQEGQGKAGANPPASLSDSSNPAAISGNEPSVSFSSDDPKSYDAGTYQVGEDIPAGEYFFWTGAMLAPDSVKVNDFTCLSGELYCLTVRVNEGDTLTSDYRFTAAENVNPVKATNGILISGKYKIGKDIAPGEYKISPIDKNTAGRYYSVLDGEISNKTEFNEDATVVVPEEGYVVFYNSALTVK